MSHSGRLFLSLVLVVICTLVNPLLRLWIPVANLVPILLVLWAWRLEPTPLMVTVFSASLLADFLVPEAFGLGPLLWGILIFVARSQHGLLISWGYLMAGVICFATTFLYLILGRLSYMLVNGLMTWPLDLFVQISAAALMNMIVGPLLILAVSPAYPVKRSHQASQPVWTHAHA